MLVAPVVKGTIRSIRWTREARRRTGHMIPSFVRWWVRRSFFIPFFLIFERDGDTRRVGQLGVAVWNDLVVLVAEVDASQVDDFGSSWLGCGREFARSHGIEKCHNSEFRCDRHGGVVGERKTNSFQVEHCLEKLGRDRLLSLWRRVPVV